MYVATAVIQVFSFVQILEARFLDDFSWMCVCSGILDGYNVYLTSTMCDGYNYTGCSMRRRSYKFQILLVADTHQIHQQRTQKTESEFNKKPFFKLKLKLLNYFVIWRITPSLSTRNKLGCLGFSNGS